MGKLSDTDRVLQQLEAEKAVIQHAIDKIKAAQSSKPKAKRAKLAPVESVARRAEG